MNKQTRLWSGLLAFILLIGGFLASPLSVNAQDAALEEAAANYCTNKFLSQGTGSTEVAAAEACERDYIAASPDCLAEDPSRGSDYQGCLEAAGDNSQELLGPGQNDLGQVIIGGDANTVKCGSGPDAVEISIDVNCTDVDNPILAYIGGIANFLSVGIGVVLVISLTILGMQFMVSRGDPNMVKLARTRALNIVIAAATYYVFYGILRWLLPTGF